MARRVLLVLGTCLALAGCNGGSGEPPPAVSATGSERVVHVADVRRVFRRHGLPLRDVSHPLDDRSILESPAGGPIFRVEVYSSVGDARSGANLVFLLYPPGYRVRGEVVTEREANVVVVHETGRRRVGMRARAALDALP
jgi:hypothetical protein